VQLPLFLTEGPDEQHALFVRNLPPVFEVVAVGFASGAKSPDRRKRTRRSIVVRGHVPIIARNGEGGRR
jgi:hypothetical protein